MKKRVFIHIGLHKTATTTIQRSLFKDSKKLKKSGWLCPSSGASFPLSSAQHNIASQLSGHRKFRAKMGGIEDLIEEVKESKYLNFIVSSEELSRLSDQQIKSLYDHLADYSVSIIVYLRRQDLMLQSTWSEIVKKGNTRDTFENWIQKKLRTRKEDYYSLINAWEKSFGFENILVRPFEKKQFDGDIYQDFLKTCGVLDYEKFNIAERANVSPSYKSLEMTRFIVNRIHGTPAFAHRKIIARSVNRFSELKGWNESAINIISPEIHKEIMSVYKRSNQQVAKKYLNRDDLFYDSFKDKPIDKFDPISLDIDELNEFYVFVLADLAKKIQNLEKTIKIENSEEFLEELKDIQNSRLWVFISHIQEFRSIFKKK